MKSFPLLAALLLGSTAGAAEPPTPLDTLVVTGQREATRIGRLPEAVIVIDRQEIAASAAGSVAELLRSRAGVEVLDFFGDGSRATVGLRGFGANAVSNTLVLLDGRPLNNPDIGSPNLGRIRLENIERIEILHRGGALYRAQAVGGALHIITRRHEPGAADISLGGGSYSRRGVHASVTRQAAGVTLQLDAHHLDTANYRDHNALTRSGAELALSGQAGPVRWQVGGEYGDEDLETPGALFAEELREDRRQSAADFSGDFSRLITLDRQASADWAIGEAWNLHLALARRNGDGRFRLSFRGFASEPADQDRRLDTAQLRLTRRLLLAGREAQLQLGSDLRRARYRLNSQFGPQRNAQTVDAVYLGASLPLAERWDLSLALRHAEAEDRLRDGGDFATVPDGRRIGHHETLGSMGLAWRPWAGFKIFAGWDQVLRYPKVDEYFQSGFTPASFGLEPQTGDSFELGGQFGNAVLSTSLLLFRLDLADEIVFDPGSFTNTNLDASRRSGLLFDTRWSVLPALSLEASYTLVDAELRAGDQRGNAIPLVAEQVARLAADWQTSESWQLRLETQASDRRRLAGDFDNSLAPLPGYAVVNLAVRHRRGAWDLGLRLNNVLDKAYSEQGIEAPGSPDTPAFFPMPEFNVRLSLNWRL